jgi:hypothetical protein
MTYAELSVSYVGQTMWLLHTWTHVANWVSRTGPEACPERGDWPLMTHDHFVWVCFCVFMNPFPSQRLFKSRKQNSVEILTQVQQVKLYAALRNPQLSSLPPQPANGGCSEYPVHTIHHFLPEAVQSIPSTPSTTSCQKLFRVSRPHHPPLLARDKLWLYPHTNSDAVPKWSLVLRFYKQDDAISHWSHTCYMLSPLIVPNNIVLIISGEEKKRCEVALRSQFMPFTKYFTLIMQLFRIHFKTSRLADNFTRSSDKLYVSRNLQTPDIFVSVVRKNTLVSWDSLLPFNGTTLSIMEWIMKLRMST